MTERSLAAPGVLHGASFVEELSDAELLERFVAKRDEAAFAALMARHGPMVFGVCRRMLRRAQDAEDAFQATFLILVRKAASIGRRELLAHWLYRVAVRVAARARQMAAKQRTREAADNERRVLAMHQPTEATETSAAVVEEVNRLPVRYRIPLVLYYFQSLTSEQVADELGCGINTIRTRLSRGREMLRKRLIRRGLVLTTAAFSSALLAQASAALPPALIHSTLKAAVCFAAGDAAAGGGVSAQTLTLTKGVLHTMFVTKMKTMAMWVLALVLVLGGVGAFAYQRLATAAEADNKDKKKIQGTWRIVSLTRDGRNDVLQDKLKEARFIITADKFTVNAGNNSAVYRYKLNPKAKPMTMDIYKNEKGGKLERLCVYKLERDSLTICQFIDRIKQKKQRPKDVESKAGSATILTVLERVKE